MKTLLAFCAWIDRINERIGLWASWLTLIAVVVCTVNALVRYSLHMSSNAWLELQWYLNAGMFLLVAAYALKINAHVRIDVIAGKLSARAQAWIDVIGGLLFLLPMALIIAWYALPSLANSWRIQEMSSDPGGLIRWPMRLLIPVAFVLLALQGVSEVVKRCAYLMGRGPNPVDAKAHEAPREIA
jgi:TRAP-type mannitol/chloroaromatic compound transport system permease small subunit